MSTLRKYLSRILCLGIAVGAFSVAQGVELPHRAPAKLPMEKDIDAIAAAWPDPMADFDRAWVSIAALAESLKSGYAEALAIHHTRDTRVPVEQWTPQALARRNGRTVERSGEIPRWRPDTTGPPPVYRMPYHPHYRGIQCLTPIPGKPATWCDFVLLNPVDRRVHATRFDEQNILRAFVLIQWEGTSWRALELTFYPDARPERLRFWKDGAPDQCRIDWTPTGDRKVVPVRDGQYEGEAPFAVCTVSVSYLPPGKQRDPAMEPRRLFPMPVGALHLIPLGGAARIEAPLLGGYDLAGWSGDGTGRSPLLEVRPQGPVNLVAHYHWGDATQKGSRPLSAPLEDALRRHPQGVDAVKSSIELLPIAELDLSATRFDDLYQLRYFRNLNRVDLTAAPARDFFPLSPHAAIEAAFSGPTSLMQSDLFNRLLLALHAGVAPPIETLVLRDVDLSEAQGLEFLAQLKHLDVRKTSLRKMDFVPYLDELESLDAGQNDLADASILLYMGPKLAAVNLERNQIAELSSLETRTVWPAGMSLALSGNPLCAEALCTSIPALQAAGIAVTFDGACENLAARISDEDEDGDGYTNREEWQFVSLFSALEPEREAKFAAAIQDPETPRGYLSNLPASASGEKVSIDSISTASVEFIVTGKGSIYPGHGTHEFADKIFKDDGTWAWNSITFRPAPAPGWEMIPLNEHFFATDFFKKEENGPGFVISMQTSLALQIEFRETQEAITVDLVDALKAFVEKYFPGEDSFAFDRNDLLFNSKEGDGAGPNGMPDAAELRLLQAILQTPTYDNYYKGGTSHAEALEIWKANLTIATRAFGKMGEEEPYLVHLMAGYATLGSFHDRGAYLALIRVLKGVEIERDIFEQGLFTILAPDETIHNRATFNEDIWKQVAGDREVNRKVVDAYAAAVLAQPTEP